MTSGQQGSADCVRNGLPWWALAAAVVFADFLTKHWIRLELPQGAVVPLASFFNLVSARNSGAAFSMFSDAGNWSRYILIGVAVMVSVALVWLLTTHLRRLEGLAYSLVLGGAVGNAVDRWVFGRVTDFLDFHLAGWHWPAFNVADIAICSGVASLLISTFSAERPHPAAREGR
ncbi:signal peptidase II [Variovorax sp. RA8]|uniref:signal peptidase II n=1 Tax=Variovorax sp. (strain JCM 16519 / RA8) TaxID=662548 RepID=UPI000ABEF5F0|nr:signal peptidase II [Variovorax sp. RA8]VTU42392.1 Lipoprotein signal peptidase [Variovorax sp. RA8]